MTEYTLRPIGNTLPDHPSGSTGGRPPVYFPALETIAAAGQAGTWYELAVFKSPTGARDSLQKMTNGERPIPKGDWEFAKRQDADNGTSALYVRWMGEA